MADSIGPFMQSCIHSFVERFCCLPWPLWRLEFERWNVLVWFGSNSKHKNELALENTYSFTDLERSEVWSFADFNRVGIRVLRYNITLHNNTILSTVAVGDSMTIISKNLL